MRDEYRAIFDVDPGQRDHRTIFVVDKCGVCTPDNDDRLGVIYSPGNSQYFLAPGCGTTSSSFEAFVYSERAARKLTQGLNDRFVFRPIAPHGKAAPVGANACLDTTKGWGPLRSEPAGTKSVGIVPQKTPFLDKTPSAASESQRRKATPVWAGVLRYFPDAICAVARLSKAGNDKHNPGQALHWARDKSTDHEDCVARHLLTPEIKDKDTGEFHAAAIAWRALAQLQLLEEQRLGTEAIAVQLAMHKVEGQKRDGAQEECRDAEPAEDDGWRPFNGSVAAVPGPLTYVDVHLRAGDTITGVRANHLLWEHDKSGGDIMAYRLRNDLNLPEVA